MRIPAFLSVLLLSGTASAYPVTYEFTGTITWWPPSYVPLSRDSAEMTGFLTYDTVDFSWQNPNYCAKCAFNYAITAAGHTWEPLIPYHPGGFLAANGNTAGWGDEGQFEDGPLWPDVVWAHFEFSHAVPPLSELPIESFIGGTFGIANFLRIRNPETGQPGGTGLRGTIDSIRKVPEPPTVLLMLAGILAFGVTGGVRRKNIRQPSGRS